MENLENIFSENEKKSIHYSNKKQLIENLCNIINRQDKSFNLNEATAYANTSLGSDYDINGLYHFWISLTNRTFDHLQAKDMVGIQPMNGPVGLYYALRYYANSTYDSESNIELGTNRIDSSYTGSYEVSASEQLGSNTNVGLGIGNGTGIKDLNIKLEKKQVEAKSRKLRARFTEELIQDFNGMHNINLKEALINGMAAEIAAEIDNEIITKIESVATSGSLDFSTVAGDNKADKYASFVSYVISKANVIGSNTNMGVGNYIIASPNICTVLESTPFYTVATAAEDYINNLDKVYCAGKINEKKLYRNIFWDTDKYVVGYKGSSDLHAGIFYLPYILTALESSGENTFQPNLLVHSRYAIGESIFGANNFYQKVDITNYD